MPILIDPERCSGCRVCELVCSYHFTRFFQRKVSAIEVKRNEEDFLFEITIHRESNGRRYDCDLCIKEKMPLCVKYCTMKALNHR